IVRHTRDVVYLNDGDVVIVTPENFQITSLDGRQASYQVSQVDFAEEAIELGDYPHYMLKEIFEQPESIANAMRGRLNQETASAQLGGLNMTPAELRAVER